jgi:hypothetical protein
MAVTTNTPRGPVSSSGIEPGGLHGIKPPVEIPNFWLWAVGITAAILVVAALFWFYFYRKKLKRAASSMPPIPAHLRARKRLEEALRLIDEPKPFCTYVSDTIRAYLEERFNFHAPDRTTEEFLNELRDTDLLTPDQKDSLGEFLQQCDLVKFARYEPTQTELRALHDSAVRLVSETEPEFLMEALNPSVPTEIGKNG